MAAQALGGSKHGLFIAIDGPMSVVCNVDESMSYVHSLLQLETVTSVLMICFDEKFGFQITTERG